MLVVIKSFTLHSFPRPFHMIFSSRRFDLPHNIHHWTFWLLKIAFWSKFSHTFNEKYFHFTIDDFCIYLLFLAFSLFDSDLIHVSVLCRCHPTTDDSNTLRLFVCSMWLWGDRISTHESHIMLNRAPLSSPGTQAFDNRKNVPVV